MIDSTQLDFLPLYLDGERLEFGKGNSAFNIDTNQISFDSVYPFREGRIFVLKTPKVIVKLEVVEARQVGQSDFIATLRPIEKGINLIDIVQQLKEYHGQ